MVSLSVYRSVFVPLAKLSLPILLQFIEQKFLSTSISEQIKRGYQLLRGADGLISSQSLVNSLAVAGCSVPGQQINLLIDEADSNCDGFVSEAELINILLS